MNIKLSAIALCWLWLVCSLAACTARFEPIELTALPASVSQPDAREIDVEVVLAGAENQVRKVLPDAYLEFFGFSGDCRELPHLRGTINLGFDQVQQGIVRQQVLVASVSVNTVEETMDLRFADHSSYYIISTAPLLLQNSLPVREIAVLAYENIIRLGAVPCDVNLTWSGVRDTWLVECTAPGSGSLGPRRCEFEIEPLTGQVRGTQQ